MSYPDSVQFLYSLGNELKAGAKFDLERIKTVLLELGSPQQSQRFVHIAGTNGKGSTSAMLASAFAGAALRTGLYTSPHLVEPTERIQINGQPVSKQQFADAFQLVHATAEQLLLHESIDAHPSYFETVTAMAFVLFREFACDIGVIEVGLGGRLDATNVIQPDLCIITPVSYDHEAFLGNTLASIASEKAGILKPGVPVVVAAQTGEVDAVITSRALELGCPIIRTSHAPIQHLVVTPRSSQFQLNGTSYTCPLAGRHQIENARAAILAGRHLGLTTEQIQRGLAAVHWPGRLEFVRQSPDFVLDGAHNPAGAAALAVYIQEFCAYRPVWLVYGAMRDKAIEEVTGQLFPLAHHLIITAPDFPRALRPEAILEVTSHAKATIAATVKEAIALASLAPPNAIVFFTGSLFLVGEASALLRTSNS